MPPCLKLPNLKYDGMGAEHLKTYKIYMELNSASYAFQCQAFFITLIGIARRWFKTQGLGSIFSFRQLSKSFFSQFSIHKVKRKPVRHLYTIKQKDNERNKVFLNHFMRKEMSFKDRNASTTCGVLMVGLRSTAILKYMVSVEEDIAYLELITKIHCHIQAKKDL